MPPRMPPEEIALMMRYIAEKAEHVTSPMNVADLCRQFKEETGTLMSVECLKMRVYANRHKIHEMNEFDVETKVKMIFALSAPINAEFLIGLKKVADVEVDEQQRIIHYKQNNGKLELSSKKHMQLSKNMGEQRDKSIIQFLAEKAKFVNTPIMGTLFLREFKAKSGCSDSIESLKERYARVKNTIFELSGIDKNTKVKMMFISNLKLSDDILEELRQNADIEVDERRRITKYKSNDGSLEVEKSRKKPTNPSFRLGRWQKICEKVTNDESEEDDNEGSYKKQQIDLMKFLIEKTKNVTSPLKIKDLSRNFQKECKVSGPWTRFNARVRNIRPRIFNMNEFDVDTKVKMLFALSAKIDDGLLKELQKDAIVELDHKERIAKYEAKDGSLNFQGEHSKPAKGKLTLANKKKARVVDDSSDSDEDGDKKNMRKRGRKSDQTATSSSSSLRRSQRIKNRMSGGIKRARYSYSSSEISKVKSSEEKDNDEESMKSENDAPMDSGTSRVDNGGDDFDFEPPRYHQDSGDDIDYDTSIHNKENLEQALAAPNLEVSSDKKEKAGPSSSSVKIETMSLLEFLTHLHRPIVKMKVPFYANKIDSEIEKLKEKDRQIPINTILESLQLFLQILKTPNEMDSVEETAPFSEVLHYLELSVCYLTHPLMNGFQRELRKLVAADDQQIPMNHIRYAMKETLDKILR